MSRPYILLLFVSLLVSSLLSAQTREDAARDDLGYGSARSRQVEDNQAGDLWYGAGATIGFSANQFSSLFRIGVSPMVGYKFNNIFSAGPRASLIYTRYNNDAIGTDNSITWSAGLFARAKVYRSFFLHAEYSLLSEKDYGFFGASQFGNRVTRAIPYLGGGINQGGGLGSAGFEFMILFRLTPREYANDTPYEIRSGFTYNF
ncbi:hypothetical protein [Lewinella sp. IMCC34191]|uniref:hypothetical protein n=1 Tax=Lewinella sp. IMCC34191 TaxID=2259172 RepID=UPI000E253EE6|nr:hypothetical protein [Lewinella sp. IMCC34191]